MPLTVYSLKPRFQAVLRPLTRRLHADGITANQVTVAAMSAIKPDRGVKDWGHMIEGHGGMLDRLVSVCFAAPIFFHVVRHFYT